MPESVLTPDELQLLDILRIYIGNPSSTKLDRLSAEEWNTLLWTAGHHTVTPIVLQVLNRKNSTIVIPVEIRQRLADLRLKIVAKALLLRKQLTNLLQLFKENGITVIPLKGAYLAPCVYKDFSLRPMRDIDLWILPEQRDTAAQLLVSAGYKEHWENRLNRAQELELMFLREGDYVMVELHSAPGLRGSGKVSASQDMLSRLQAVSIDGITVSAPSIEDQIIYIAYHSARHFYRSSALRSFLDIALMAKQFPAIQWDAVCDRAKQWNIFPSVALSLTAASHLLQFDIPLPAEESDRCSRYLSDVTVEIFFSTRERPAIPDGLGDLLTQRTVFGKLRSFWSALFVPREKLARIYYADERSFLINRYYFVRFKDLLIKWGPGILRAKKAVPEARKQGERLNRLREGLQFD